MTAARYRTFGSWEPGNQLQIGILLDDRDEEIEAGLATLKAHFLSRFHGFFDLDFTTIHLQGRHPEEFVPAGALYLRCADRSSGWRVGPDLNA
jgi:hypothetical protein